MKEIKVGIIGSGFVADYFHLPAYRQIAGDGVIVSSIAGIEKDAIQALAKKWSIGKTYVGEDAISKICSDKSIDVIDICAPNFVHEEVVKLAAENGKHIICEKPLGRNSEEAQRILKYAERAGIIHCYAENQVFLPHVAKAKEFIKSGGVGNLLSIRAREAHSGPHSKWFKQKKLAGGGVMLDMGCHCIEVVRHIMGENPTEIMAWTDTLSHDIDVDDSTVALMKFPGKSLGQIESNWCSQGGFDMRLEIYGTEGSIFIDCTRDTGIKCFTNAGAAGVVEKAGANTGWLFPVVNEPWTYGHVDQLRHFTSCIREGKEPIETFRDGLTVNRIIDAAYASSKNKKWEKIL